MTTVAARWVVPVSRPPIEDGLVAVEDGRIAWLGRRGAADAPRGELRDLGDGVLLPGLVNAHCHLELSHLAKLRPQAEGASGFVRWIEAVVEARATRPADEARRAAAKAFALLDFETGTAAVGDVSNTLVHLDELGASRLTAVVFFELLGWDPVKAPAILGAADARLATLPGSLRRRGVQVRLAAHAPHSVSPALFAGLLRRSGPGAVHLAESSAETVFLEGGAGEWREFLIRRGVGHVDFQAPGTSPVRYLERLGVLRAGLLAAHCVHVDAEDRALLAIRGVSVAVCPTSNRSLGVGRAPVPALLAAGVNVCAGTDSAASGASLDVLGELRALREDHPGLDPATVLRIGTLNGAHALGLDDLGCLEPGKRAELFFAPGHTADPLAFLLSPAAAPRRWAP